MTDRGKTKDSVEQPARHVLEETYRNLLQRLRQFGRLQEGRIFGSTFDTDGRHKAWMDLFEKVIFARAELNALTKLLIDKGVFTQAEWLSQVTDEAAWLFEQEMKHWPEIEVAEDGKSFAIKDMQAFANRCQRERWPP